MANKKYKISKFEIARRERIKEAEKKTKRKKQIKIIGILAAVVLTITAIIVVFSLQPTQVAGTYYSGSEYVTLNTDGSFNAYLPHSETKSGTYEINGTTIIFTVDNQNQQGIISGRNLTIPYEWDHGHGHNTLYIKR